jgi:transcriptional regulator with XRE-family HTH domain
MMTPFSDLLFNLRRSKGLRQKELADKLNMGSSYLSGLESGHKEPPGEEQLKRFALALELNAEQTEEFVHTAELSRRRIEIPIEASKEEFLLVHEFAAELGTLSHAQIEMMRLLLRINRENNQLGSTR